MGIFIQPPFWRTSSVLEDRAHWSLKEVVAPTVEPITLAQAKIHLRIDDSYFDADVTAQIVAARQQVEKETSRFIARATYDYSFDAPPTSGVIRLPYTPVSSVTSLTMYDANDVGTVVTAANYLLDRDSDPPRLVLDYTTDVLAWYPDAGLRDYRAGVLRFVGGPEEGAATPAWAVQAMYLLLEWWRAPKLDTLLRDSYEYAIQPYRLEGVA